MAWAKYSLFKYLDPVGYTLEDIGNNRDGFPQMKVELPRSKTWLRNYDPLLPKVLMTSSGLTA